MGGKTQLLPELQKRMPPGFRRYFEPFLGGGALFFRIKPTHARLTDVNPELINAYQTVQQRPVDLIAELNEHRHDKDEFYRVRGADRTPDYPEWSAVQRAARLIYLNKTCFNGLYRVNSRGQFNVPFGRYSNPTICDPENLQACSQALRNAEIACASYLAVEEHAADGDFVYFDPPYEPLNATSNFTSYVQGGFGARDQEALRDLCRRLHQKGVKWMLSNSVAPLILDLYAEFQIDRVGANRAVNSRADRRGKIEEVIVRNYVL